MNQNLFFFFICACFALLAAALVSASNSNNNNNNNVDAFSVVPRPAWVRDNRIDAVDHTFAAGAPYVNAIGDYAFIINGAQDYIKGSTTVCVFDATLNGTCDKTVIRFDGASWKIPSISLSNADDGSYFIDAVYQGDQIAETSTFRWNAAYGVEWFKFRGEVAKNSYIPFPRANTFVMSVAVDGGAVENIVGAATVDHAFHVFWTTPVTIPAANVKNYTSYATDFVTIAPHADMTMLAFTSLGRVFAINADDGVMMNQMNSPCGYNSTEMKMLRFRLTYSRSVLIVYGNVPSKGFVLCGLEANISLTEVFAIEVGENITTANGDFSIDVIESAFDNGFYPVPTTNLFVSGMIDNNATKTNLWSFDIMNQSLNWVIHRDYNDRFNMPVFMDGNDHEHIIVTINGTTQSINPVTGNLHWSCNYTARGCASTPTGLRFADGELGRMFCVSAKNPQLLISLAIDKQSNLCSVAWETTVPSPIFIQAQPMANLIVNFEFPLEPFVVFVDQEGVTWSISARNEFEKPHYAPIPPPVPKPTMPPTNAPGPKAKYVRQPPADFSDLFLVDYPSITQFGETYGTVVQAVGRCIFLLDEQGNKKSAEEVAKSETVTVFYYQSVPIGSNPVVYYGYQVLNGAIDLLDPLTVFSDNSQVVTASVEANNVGALVLLFTNTTSGRPVYEDYPRFGAYSQIAAMDGYIFYSSGVYDGQHETVWAIIQRGDGTKTKLAWPLTFGDTQAPRSFKNFTSHIGDLVLATANQGATATLIFSYLNILQFRDVLNQGADARTPVTNPCGFQPAPSYFHKYIPMIPVIVKTAVENLAVISVDMGYDKASDSYSYGLCIFDANNNLNQVGNGVTLNNTLYIGNTQPIGSDGLFAVEYLSHVGDLYWTNLTVIDAKTGTALYTEARNAAYGETILPMPGGGTFITNTDDPTNEYNMLLTLIESQTGVHVATCDVGCEIFTLTQDSTGNPTVICQVAGFISYIRAFQFDVSNKKCNVYWETDIGTPIQGMNSEDIDIKGTHYVAVVTEDGYIVTIEPDAGNVPTPVPPIPTGFSKPSYAQVMNLSAEWIDPKAIDIPYIDILSLDFTYGAVGFTSVNAIPAHTTSDSDTNVQASKSNTAIIAYQALVPVGSKNYDAITAVFEPDVFTMDPVFIGRSKDRTAAVVTTTTGQGFLVALSFPVGYYPVPRFHAFSAAATDENGNVFFAVGSYDDTEHFVSYNLNAEGTVFKPVHDFALVPPTGKYKIPNFTSHVGNPVYVQGPSNQGYVTFSFYDTLITLDAEDLILIKNVTSPCGFAPPLNPFDNYAPYPMQPNKITLGNRQQLVATIIPVGPDFSKGFYGVCGTTADGVTTQFQFALNTLANPITVEKILSLVDLIGTDFFVLDVQTQPVGDGVIIGVDATTGDTWQQSRVMSKGSPAAANAYLGQFMVINWDDPTHSDKFLSLIDVTSGNIGVQCSWSCANQPVSAQVMIDNVLQPIYVCTLDGHVNVVRAVYFKQITGQTGYTCETYWEYELEPASLAAMGFSVSGANDISVGLSNGGAATFGLKATNAPLTPVPQQSTPTPNGNNGNNGNNGPSNGLGGGVIAAIVILTLLAVAIGVVGVYVIRRRNVRRSALADATSGMEYGSNADQSGGAGQGEGGYGAIA